MRLPITLQNEGAVDKPLAMCKNRASRKTKRSSQGEVQMLSELVEDIKRVAEEAETAHNGLEEKKYHIEDLMTDLSGKKDTLEDALGYLEEAQNAMEDLENYSIPDAQEIINS